MRIVGGKWRGRRLIAPPGNRTRPTSDRTRQALFDMLLHAPWGGREAVIGARVLDAFAGTGALGLEALSRGAGFATFIERDRAALAALAANIAALDAHARCHVLPRDVLSPPAGEPSSLIFLDPPYGQELLGRAVASLAQRGWLAPGALIVAESGTNEPPPQAVSHTEHLVDRDYGPARITVWRWGRE